MEKQQIVAMIPMYGEHGEHQTRIICENSQEAIHPHKVKSLVEKIATEEWLHIRAQKRAISRNLFQSNNAPIILNEHVYVCLKMRKPRVEGDGAYGYIRADEIESIAPSGKTSEVKLRNGVTVPILTSYSTLSRHVAIGKLLAKQ